MLVAVSDLCGELDMLLALAQGASQNKLVRPQLTTSNTFIVKQGRHLLQEMAVPSFVPNDLTIAGGTTSLAESHTPTTLVLTGPNFSGKTVYLKTHALITYLAHIGSFVPAASAIVPLTDAILTRLSTRETVSRIESAFLLDLQQISQCLTLASSRSLVLIDEFGKGTDSADGAGLCAGVLQHFVNRPPEEAPRVLLATHFHDIFEQGFVAQSSRLAFGHMAVSLHPQSSAVSDQVVYLYNFTDGRSNESFGTVCAAMNGIPDAVVERASRLSEVARRGEDLVSVCCGGMDDEERRGLEEAERCGRRLLAEDFSPSEDEVGWEEILRQVMGIEDESDVEDVVEGEDMVNTESS